MKKKLMAVLMSVVMIITSLGSSAAIFGTAVMASDGNSSAAVTFSDVVKGEISNGAYKSIYWAAENGYVRGYTGTDIFGVGDSMTREQLVTILWRMAGRPSVTLPDESPFTDVSPSKSTYKAIIWAYEEGIIKGYSDGTFGPMEPVKRNQAVIILWRMQGRPAAENTEAEFSDVNNEEDSWFTAVQWASEAGLVKGYGDGTFRPENDCKREEMVVILYRYSESQESSEVTSSLKVGAGTGEIVFPEEMFPMSEGFSTIHDNPHARVIVIENGQKAAIVSMELVNTPSDCIDIIKQVVNEKTGTPIDNIWVQSTHVFCAPHAPDDAEQRAMFNEAVTAAITEAAEEAAASFQPAVMGIGTGECDLTASRDVQTTAGDWVWALNGSGFTNPEITITKFESLSGETIGMFYAYSTRSYCADVTRGSSTEREITSDWTGVAASMLEEEYGATAMFLPTASADQSPVEAAQDVVKDENGLAVVDENGETTAIDLGVQAGLEIAESMGTRLGNILIEIAETIECTDEPEVQTGFSSFDWPTSDYSSEMTIDMMAITIGELAMVGIQPEANAITGVQLAEESPYANTLLMSFVNGDQKYMPDAECYELGKPEVSSSSLAVGAAEECVTTAAALLEAMHNGTYSDESDDDGDDAYDFEKYQIEFGGYSWTVVAEEDDNLLIVCDQPVTSMAYKADGSATTWETSDVREYLNSTFINEFSEAEKARIQTVTLENKSNSQYGTAGGNDTEDQIFLLSETEARTYYSSNEERILTDTEGNAVMWLLRTPGRDGEYVCDVSSTGYIETHGILVVDASDNETNAGGDIKDYASGVNGAIRPAMWIAKEETEEPVLLYKFLTDISYTAIITDSDQDQYFKEGTALEGVEAILDAGQYYINGFQVPATEEECGSAFVIMGYDKLYKDEDGNWNAENNKRTGTDFIDARLGMVEALSRTSGMPVYLYDTDGDGYTDMIYSVFYAVALVDSLIDNGDGTISIDRGDFELTKTNIDVNDIKFDKDNVDSEISEGDFVMFWEDAEEGWKIEREIPIEGYLTDAADHQYYVFNGETIIDGMNNPKASINVANRPGQYSNAHLAFGLDDVEITFWVTTEGNVASGFTSNDNASVSLERAIATCEEYKAEVVISEDGTELDAGSKWVTSEVMEAYEAAIQTAKDALADTTKTNSALDTQIYNLFVATWGSSAKYEKIKAGEITGGFLGSINTAEAAQYQIANTSSGIIDNEEAQEYFEDGDVETALETLLNAGKVMVNGITVPTSEDDAEALSKTDVNGNVGYTVNGYVSFWKNEDGTWDHCENGSGNEGTFTEIRISFINALTETVGLDTIIIDSDKDGYADAVNVIIKESVLVDKIIDNADGTKSISHGNFTYAQPAYLAWKPLQPSANDAVFAAENFDSAIYEGAVCLYWEADDGWHIEAADATEGYLTDGEDHGYYIFNGEMYVDGRINKVNLINGNRPGQYLMAHLAFGLQDEEVIMWSYNGYPIGYTSKDTTDMLEKAIASAKAVSSESEDLETAIAAAETVFADPDSTNGDKDLAIYNMYAALPEDSAE